MVDTGIARLGVLLLLQPPRGTTGSHTRSVSHGVRSCGDLGQQLRPPFPENVFDGPVL